MRYTFLYPTNIVYFFLKQKWGAVEIEDGGACRSFASSLEGAKAERLGGFLVAYTKSICVVQMLFMFTSVVFVHPMSVF